MRTPAGLEFRQACAGCHLEVWLLRAAQAKGTAVAEDACVYRKVGGSR